MIDIYRIDNLLQLNKQDSPGYTLSVWFYEQYFINHQ